MSALGRSTRIQTQNLQLENLAVRQGYCHYGTSSCVEIVMSLILQKSRAVVGCCKVIKAHQSQKTESHVLKSMLKAFGIESQLEVKSQLEIEAASDARPREGQSCSSSSSCLFWVVMMAVRREERENKRALFLQYRDFIYKLPNELKTRTWSISSKPVRILVL